MKFLYNLKHKLTTSTCIILISILLLSSCSTTKPSASESNSNTISTNSSNQSQESEIKTAIVKDYGSTVAGVSEENPEQNIESVENITITNSDSALIRIALPAGITSSQVESAYLKLKLQETDGAESPTIQATPVTTAWDRIGVNWNQIKDNTKNIVTDTGKIEQDSWYSIDITNIVKEWLSGEIPNYGLLLEETGNAKSVFSSPYSEDENCPELIINYRNSTIDKKFSPFGYEKQQDGNCLSFALRDTDPIFHDSLNIDMEIVQEKFDSDGINSVLDYVKDLTIDYVETNKESLEISSFREVDSFDAPIEDDEYIIALRVGIQDKSFDYHLQVQLEDGTWAEKFGTTDSRIVPGSNSDIDPGLYPWDQNEFWGLDKWNSFYDSDTVYFAVTKDSPNFTNHLSNN